MVPLPGISSYSFGDCIRKLCICNLVSLNILWCLCRGLVNSPLALVLYISTCVLVRINRSLSVVSQFPVSGVFPCWQEFLKH